MKTEIPEMVYVSPDELLINAKSTPSELFIHTSTIYNKSNIKSTIAYAIVDKGPSNKLEGLKVWWNLVPRNERSELEFPVAL